MYVNCTVKGESDKDAAGHRLRVIEQLRKYNDPSLWTHVSSLVLSNDGELDLRCVITTTDAVNALKWLLMSSAGNDVRELE